MDTSKTSPSPKGPFIELNLQKGVSLVSLVAALVILGLLYVGYDSLHRSGEAAASTIATGVSASHATACRMNCAELERTVLTWSISHPGLEPTWKRLRDDHLFVPDCPDGGRLSLQGKHVTCSLHSPQK